MTLSYKTRPVRLNVIPAATRRERTGETGSPDALERVRGFGRGLSAHVKKASLSS